MSQKTVFIRLLQADEKATALSDAIASISEGGTANAAVHAVDTVSFSQVPGSAFAYWVSERVRRLFRALPPFESEGRRLRLGDHFRYLRLRWEVPVASKTHEWVEYYKGGTNRPYYDETCLVVDWDSSRKTYRNFHGRPGRSSERPSNYQYFLLPGLTCPNRPHLRGYFSHVSPGGVFGHTSPMLHLPAEAHWSTCAILNSGAFVSLLHLLMARGSHGGQTLKYEVGYLRSVPIPATSSNEHSMLTESAEAAYRLARSLSTGTETSHVFCVPELLQAVGDTLEERIARCRARFEDSEGQSADRDRQIDEIAFRLYGIHRADRLALQEAVDSEGSSLETDESCPRDLDDDVDVGQVAADRDRLVADVVSYSVGCSVGRWDFRFATGEKTLPELPGPFVSLPICSPGMLMDADGLPARREAGANPTGIGWDGILVDGPDHPDDVIRRVRDVLEAISKDRSDAIEKEACEIIGVSDLRDYFRKPGPGGFWDDHVKRYSKSRRKAPIYWLLQSSKKNYALWLYYHRLGKDILFKALLNYVEPKIKLVLGQLSFVRGQIQSTKDQGQRTKDQKKLEKEAERLESFLSELRDFEDKLRRAANLHLDPDLNDGVVLNIAPLHELVPWKEARNYWDELLEGKYEWSAVGNQLRERGLVK